jgi:hypothetical protein
MREPEDEAVLVFLYLTDALFRFFDFFLALLDLSRFGFGKAWYSKRNDNNPREREKKSRQHANQRTTLTPTLQS